MSKQTILVVGGAGYIGSHVAKMLEQKDYQPLIFDNFSTGSKEVLHHHAYVQGDLADPNALNKVFEDHNIDAVMHFAALTDVGESVANPIKYYANNVSKTLNLLECMRKHAVKYFIFSSSAAIFGIPTSPLINETAPCLPINPYGASKLMVEKILQDCDIAYGLKSSCLRYFNAAGGDPEGKIKNYKRKENNLIPLILRSLKDYSQITIFGTDYPTFDGTCIRDYIHIEDLGAAHLLAMEKLFEDSVSTQYNLGNGHGFSVKQVIAAAEHVTGLKVNAIAGERRMGDPPILLADSQKAMHELGWQPQYADLNIMIKHAWQAI